MSKTSIFHLGQISDSSRDRRSEAFFFLQKKLSHTISALFKCSRDHAALFPIRLTEGSTQDKLTYLPTDYDNLIFHSRKKSSTFFSWLFSSIRSLVARNEKEISKKIIINAMCVFAHAIEQQQQPRAHRLTRLASNFMWIELDFLIRIWCYDVVGRWRGQPPSLWQQHQIERKKKKRSECRYLIWISRLHTTLSFARVELVATLVTKLAPLTTFLLLRWIAQQRLQSERVAQFLVLCLRQRRKNILSASSLCNRSSVPVYAVSKSNPLFDREK